MKLMTTPQAANAFGLTQRQLKQLRLSGRIPHYRIGHRTIVYRADEIKTALKKARVGE